MFQNYDVKFNHFQKTKGSANNQVVNFKDYSNENKPTGCLDLL